jgi:hypothetical protein
LLCSMSALHVKIVPLLDVHQLLMSAGTLTYLEPGTFSLIAFFIIRYNFYLLLLLIAWTKTRIELSYYYYYYYYYYYFYYYCVCLFASWHYVFVLQCLPLIRLWFYVGFSRNVIICTYTVLYL